MTWSCVRSVSSDELSKRDPNNYGFLASDNLKERKVGDTEDFGYVDHIPNVPRITSGVGYLHMQMPPRLRHELLNWFKTHYNTSSVLKHEPIYGEYTNIHSNPMDKIDLDKFQDVRGIVIDEMKRVLEWWSGIDLYHTSTFGARIYHNDSMLINHVDRHQTHIASAVLQVAQDVDEGWPLEILDGKGGGVEVYMQPGEMILYEGATFKHGRPMRFRGRMFGNVFTHFAPTSMQKEL